MSKIRCRVTSFHNVRIGQLSPLAVAVKNGVYTHATLFPLPPITAIVFQGFIDSYVTTYGIYEDGGSAQQGAYRTAETNLTNAMDTMAIYVDSVANGDANIITTAGFVPTKGTASPVPAPVILENIELTRGNTGQLLAESEKQEGVDVYICLLTPNEPPPANMKIVGGQLVLENDNGTTTPLTTAVPAAVLDFNKSRKKKFIGLTPGTMYYFTFFGINAQGVGDFSVPVGILCW